MEVVESANDEVTILNFVDRLEAKRYIDTKIESLKEEGVRSRFKVGAGAGFFCNEKGASYFWTYEA